MPSPPKAGPRFTTMQVVWFKRDLRVSDHRALHAACQSGSPVLCLYVFEPELWQQPDADARHLRFVHDSLADLQERLKERGGRLVVRVGDIISVLTDLHKQQPVSAIHSHEETGTLWTYKRDLAVGRWARENRIAWHEHTQNGVVRRLQQRDGWASQWHQRMSEPVLPGPHQIRPADTPAADELPGASALGLDDTQDLSRIQRGGETRALETLNTFLRQRGRRYERELSSPVTAWNSCSRLSAHLAWGNISIPQLWQAVDRRLRSVRNTRLGDRQKIADWTSALKAYGERLHWHCHFMQKLEDQPDLQQVNMHTACDGLRPSEPDPDRLAAWTAGQTGYPMVDACMRCVRITGWLNFRMRAMVVSFASYHLWLDWRPTSLHLARMFTDYEPGIHYNQFQMQSGTTGISTVRIYNPIKQVTDHDPTGTFLREWVPELLLVPDEFLAEPHLMPLHVQQASNCIIGEHYPAPIVDHRTASAAARTRMRRIRGTADARQERESVFDRHGSRRRPQRSAPGNSRHSRGSR
ncbi:MAG: DNA photolyase family protein [Planctomycetaceae bacterium]|nr:DNA photolyase family protein [Planctomycetaceae bacterium]